jgi:hypothetical protein
MLPRIVASENPLSQDRRGARQYGSNYEHASPSKSTDYESAQHGPGNGTDSDNAHLQPQSSTSFVRRECRDQYCH